MNHTARIMLPLVLVQSPLLAQDCTRGGLYGPDLRFTVGESPTQVGAEDVDLDGDIDLVVVTESGALSVLLNDATGLFELAPSIGIRSSGFVFESNTGSGYPNILAWDTEFGALVTLENLFEFLPEFVEVSRRSFPFAGPVSLHRAELTTDEFEDLVFVVKDENAVYVEGAGALYESFATGVDPVDATLADMDGDGQRDVVVANAGTSDVSVLLNRSKPFGVIPVFEPQLRFGLFGDTPSAIASADLDNDGDTDIVVSNRASNDVSVLLNDGSGFLIAKERFGVGNGPADVVLADIDRDTHLDIITANQGSGDITILFGSGDARFDASETFNASASPRSLVVATLASGMGPGIASVSGEHDEISVLRSRCADESLCRPDLNADGNLDFFDLALLLQSIVDYDGNTVFDFFDLSMYLGEFLAGCP